MKKSIIAAGAASVALAAMPILGAFAGQTDTIVVEIEGSCTVDLKASGHAAGVVSGDASAAATSWTGNTLSGTMTNGTYSEDYGASTLVVNCNNNSGFDVSATATALSAATLVDPTTTLPLTIPVGATIDGTVSDWSYKVTLPTGSALTNNAAAWQAASSSSIVEAATPISAGEFTVTYGTSIDDVQPADTYTGTITYGIAAKS